MYKNDLTFFKILFAGILVAFLTGCGGSNNSSQTIDDDDDDDTGNALEFSITSDAYQEGGEIPIDHVCDSYGGGNVSPQYSWANPPADTALYALIMDDETDPCGTGTEACVHWAWFDIPATASEIANDGDITSATYEGSFEGNTYIPTNDYEGPCPPNTHTYTTTIYALDAEAVGTLTTNSPSTRAGFEAAYSDSILDHADITGTFDPSLVVN